ncbi:hypothetical protein [Paenibacillus puerhi]|uniref:hypothetical protein n=1 Tax=Paenibacillus puerhi TaxID=2692622 RepID=UPI00135B9B1C|nr:hypothetical protein [Paenibacillus puerhi]
MRLVSQGTRVAMTLAQVTGVLLLDEPIGTPLFIPHGEGRRLSAKAGALQHA